MPGLPSGTVTFLFTDIDPTISRPARREDVEAASSRMEAIVRSAVEANGGYAYKLVGGGFQIAFSTAQEAVQAAVDAQSALQAEEAERGGGARVRMALHTGITEERGDDYVGPILNRLARLLAAGHGGQVLLTLATAELVRDTLPQGVALRDLGQHRLKDLYRPEQVSQLVAPGLPSDFPPLRTLDARPNNLPAQPTPFLGREKEVAEVTDILCRDDVNLLTLVGPGGIGKTRLALQVAADRLDEFSDGVFFTSLAPIADHTLVVPTIAQALGVRESGGESLAGTLAEYLQDKHLLLVLDNFEQVLDAGTAISDLLAAAPRLKVLVTSRTPLRLSMEHQYPVPALTRPDLRRLPPVEALAQYESVALFIARAQASNPTFEVNNENAPAVAEICVRLDGLPLAIELAAARTKILSPQAILERLESKLGSSLKLLTGGARDVPARHQTLRSTIEWSYDLLDDNEKQLFRRLAVFRGGSTLEAAEELYTSIGDDEAEVLDSASSLIDKSLVFQREGGSGEPRFSMLETIHDYATERLVESGEAETIEKEHALSVLRLAEKAGPELTGAQQAEWLARMEDEHDNLRAALRWAREPGQVSGGGERLETGLRTAGAIWRFWFVRGYYTEGREELTSLLTIAEAQAESAGEEIDKQLVSQPYMIWVFQGAGALTYLQGDFDPARALHGRALSLAQHLGDKLGVAAALNSLGILDYEQGNYAAARAKYEESLVIKRELGDRRGIASSLTNLGNVAFDQGDYAGGRVLHEESLAISRELGDKWSESTALTSLGNAAQALGDYATARAIHEECLALAKELGDQWGVASALNNMALAVFEEGDLVLASALHDESLAIKREIGDRRGIAISLVNLGGIAHAEGDFASARRYLSEALKIQMDIGDKFGMTAALAALAEVEIDSEGSENGGIERGARLLGSVEAMLEQTGAALDLAERRRFTRATELARRHLGDEAFNAAWAKGRALSMEETADYALGKAPAER